MALVECPDCKNEISDKAVTCPHCGSVIKARARRTYTKKATKAKTYYNWQVIVLVIIIISALGIGFWIWEIVPTHAAGHPNPVVLRKSIDKGQSSMLKQRLTLHATILNKGEAGAISLRFYLYQVGKEHVKSKVIQLNRNEMESVQETFEGIRILDGEVSYDVKAKTQ